MQRHLLALALSLAALGCGNGNQGTDFGFTPHDGSMRPRDFQSGAMDDLVSPGDATVVPDLLVPDLQEIGDTDGGIDAGSTGDATVIPGDGGTSGDLTMAAGDGATTGDAMMTAGDGGGTQSGPLATGDLSLFGVTDDNYAIYYDNATGDVDAVPLAGGAPTTIVPNSGPDVLVLGKVVFVWSAASSTGVGPLWVWTAATGAKQAANLAMAYVAAASSDGTQVLITRSTATDGTSTRIVWATSDMTSSKTLFSSVGIPQGSATTCFPQIDFAGSYAVVSRCAVNSAAATVSTVNLSTFASVDLVTGADSFWSSDAAGTEVLNVDGNMNLVVYPIAGGTGTKIDTNVAGGFLTKDGTAALYIVGMGTLKRSPVKNPSPVTLVQSGVTGFYGISSDEKWLSYFSKADSNTGLTDLSIASAIAPATPLSLDTMTDASVFGDAFTADSSRALWDSAVDINSGVGTLEVEPVTGGSATTLSKSNWVALAATGTKVVYSDMFMSSSTATTADIDVADVATTATPTKLVPQADVTYYLDAAKARVVYTLNTTNANPGLYVTAIP